MNLPTAEKRLDLVPIDHILLGKERPIYQEYFHHEYFTEVLRAYVYQGELPLNRMRPLMLAMIRTLANDPERYWR